MKNTDSNNKNRETKAGAASLAARAAEAEKQAEVARRLARLAKAKFKDARKAFKQAKKFAKQARKEAKTAAKALKQKTTRIRKQPRKKPATTEASQLVPQRLAPVAPPAKVKRLKPPVVIPDPPPTAADSGTGIA